MRCRDVSLSLTTSFWENLIISDSPEEGPARSLPPIVLLCLSVDHAKDSTWPQIHELIRSHFPLCSRCLNTFIFLFSTQRQENLQAKAQALLKAAPSWEKLHPQLRRQQESCLLGSAARAIAAVRRKSSMGQAAFMTFQIQVPGKIRLCSCPQRNRNFSLLSRQAVDAALALGKKAVISSLPPTSMYFPICEHVWGWLSSWPTQV